MGREVCFLGLDIENMLDISNLTTWHHHEQCRNSGGVVNGPRQS